MFAIIMEYIKDWKIPAVVAVVIGAGLFSMYLWAGATFVSTVEADQDFKSLSLKIESNGLLIAGLDKSMDLNEVRRDIKTTRNQQYSLSVQIEQSGESSLSRQRRVELNNDIRDLEKRETCLIAGEANC